MDPAEDDDLPTAPWLPPEDRLWRHPSEVGFLRGARAAASRARPTPWVVGVLSGSIGALLVAGVMVAAGAMTPETVRVVERVAVPSRAGTVAVDDVPDIAERVRPAIARLEITTPAGEATASAVLFRSDGHLLTNNHVVEGASSLRVVLANGQEHPANVVGGDRDTDVAVLKIEGRDYPTAVMGSVARLRVGERAIAIGSPLGLAGGPSVSVGVVSALARSLTAAEGHSLLDMIQTDAPIAPGSSGGALLDGSGAVIGITTAIAVDPRATGEGIGFATPIDTARDVARQLLSTGKVVHVWLGVEGEDVDHQNAASVGIDYGALVKRVANGSPAAVAGLAAGDVICIVEGRKVESMAALVVSLRSRKPGETVTLKVMRGGKWADLSAKLTARPST